MNLFSGLEKFGLKADEDMNLFEDENKKSSTTGSGAKEVEIPTEESFLLPKTDV